MIVLPNRVTNIICPSQTDHYNWCFVFAAISFAINWNGGILLSYLPFSKSVYIKVDRGNLKRFMEGLFRNRVYLHDFCIIKSSQSE